MKIKQKHICKQLGFSPTVVSLTLAGKRSVSWPMAERLTELFPGKSIKEWKNATPDQIKKAFSFLEDK